MKKNVEKRKGVPRGVFLAAVGCLAIIALLVGGMLYLVKGFSMTMESVQIDDVGQDAQPIVSAVWGGRLPDAASDLYYFSYGGIDGKGYARFSIPAAEWQQKYASNPSCAVIAKAEWKTIHNDQIPRDWWTPRVGEPTTLVIDNRCGGEERRKRDINIDMSNPETYTVYVIAG